MIDGFKSGMIPKEAITWKEEESRTAFQDSKILFLRNWPYVWNLANGSKSKIAGKFAVAPLPGKAGPGVSTLGGHSFGISKFAKNKGTAMKFINWMQTKENQTRRLEVSSLAPVLEELYDDPALQAKFGYLKTLGDSIRNAKPRPKAVKYNDVTLAEGTFTTKLYRLDARTQFSPWISLSNNVQFDTQSQSLGWQMRFRWIRKPGNDLYLVYTHNWLDSDRLATIDRKAAMKIVQTYRF